MGGERTAGLFDCGVAAGVVGDAGVGAGAAPAEPEPVRRGWTLRLVVCGVSPGTAGV
jgi:hypothetical protein